MSRVVGDIAHARAGDKGNTSNVSVWAYRPEDYEALKAALTPEAVREAFGGLVHGPVVRYELEHLHGLNFVIHDTLEGGVNASLNLDSHGKSFSYLVLAIPVD